MDQPNMSALPNLSPHDLYPPVVCSFPMSGDTSTFTWIYCIIYSVGCLIALLTGGYLYFKGVIKKQKAGDGHEIRRSSIIREPDNP